MQDPITEDQPMTIGVETAIRSYCDSIYDRRSLANNVVKDLVDGTASLEDVRSFFWSDDHWEDVLIFNGVLLPRVLELCPDFEQRHKLWQAVWPEYGRGAAIANPILEQRFMISIGVPEQDCGWHLQRNRPSVQRKIEGIKNKEWIELLAQFLAITTLGAKVFGLISKALQDTKSLGLSERQTEFFTQHSKDDKKSCELLFGSLVSATKSRREQDVAFSTIAAFFEQPRYRSLACTLGPIDHRFFQS